MMLCACGGEIGGGGEGGEPRIDEPTIGEPPIPGAPTDRVYGALTPYPAVMTRLTKAQYLNSIEDVFDTGVSRQLNSDTRWL